MVGLGGVTERLARVLVGAALAMAISGCTATSPQRTASGGASEPGASAPTSPGASSSPDNVVRWTATAAMMEARPYHTATLLQDGRVLVAGGIDPTLGDGIGYLASTELYDPATGSWTSTGAMSEGRYTHTATLLQDGRVLVAGGSSGNGLLASAELYDPISGTWTATGPMHEARVLHTATLLPDGKVLVAGTFFGDSGGPYSLASAEIFDPVTETWTATASMTQARGLHTATLLRDGRVLVAGGTAGDGTAAELYDPNTRTWTDGGRMVAGRSGHTATLLDDGTVLLVGGGTSAELFDPTAGWSPTRGLIEPAAEHTSTLLSDGTVLVVGGYGSSGDGLATAQLYDPISGSWVATAGMIGARTSHSATLLHDGTVLVAGGSKTIYADSLDELVSSAELYHSISAP